ncbi:DUF3703 domain-containing protein [Cupriavidus laharis]|nr:DUF3703 domain-containing protein [Cupriavidus laharis]
MSTGLLKAIDTEILLARTAAQRGDFHSSFRHLERAHVLAQWSTAQHVRVHWLMLRFALRDRRIAEAAGQLWRVAAAAVLTRFGLLPAGNPGSARISGFRASPVPADLQHAIDTAE